MITPIPEEIAGENPDTIQGRQAQRRRPSRPGDALRRREHPHPHPFKDGEPKKRMIGAKGKGQLPEELNEFL